MQVKTTEIYLTRHSEQIRTENLMKTSKDSQISNEKIILSIEGKKFKNLIQIV